MRGNEEGGRMLAEQAFVTRLELKSGLGARGEIIYLIARKSSNRCLMKSSLIIISSGTALWLSVDSFIGSRTISTASKDWERVQRDNGWRY
jgi:hypothetical protein